MTAISKQQLKQEIDRMDSQYLELAYKILRQFPQAAQKTSEKISLRGSVLRYVDPTEPVAMNGLHNAIEKST